MPLYEHVYLARQDISPQQVEALTDSYKGIIEEHGGKIAKNEYWGLKSLTYRIKKNRKAHFTLLNIDAPPAAIVEMERQMGISDDVIRHMTIKVDEHEEGPSAMMRSRGSRDDRRGRRDDRRDDRREERRESARDGDDGDRDGRESSSGRSRAAKPEAEETEEKTEAAATEDTAASEEEDA